MFQHSGDKGIMTPGRTGQRAHRRPHHISWLGILYGVMVCASLLAGLSEARATDITPSRFVTDNGLTVLVLEQPALPIIQVETLIRAGSAYDPAQKAGLANMVSALLDEGTTNRNAEQIAEEIDFIGGSLYSNVTEDFTTVSLRILKKDVGLGFELLQDVLLNPSFPEKEFTRIRNQILGVIQSEEENPGVVAGKAFNELVFGEHSYRWPVNGYQKTLASITREDIQRFYQQEYLPNQTILSIVGDITLDQAKILVNKYFSNWKKMAVSPRQYGKPPVIAEPIVKRIERNLTQSTILLGHVGIQRSNPDFYAIAVMNYVLGSGGFSSRLMDSIRDKQGLAYGVFSSFQAQKMPGAFQVSLQTKAKSTDKAISEVLREIRAIRENAISDRELEEAKSYLIGSFPLRLDTTRKLATLLSLIEFYGLGRDYFSDFPRNLSLVTKEDVLRVAKQYLHPDHYVLVIVGNAPSTPTTPSRHQPEH